MFNRAKPKPHRIDTLIGAGTRSIIGDVQFAGGLRVDGAIRGNVVAIGDKPSTLVLSEKAVIEGTVRVAHLIVNGRIHGPVYATHYVELQAKSQVTGDIHYRTLEMHPGAVVDGRLVHEHEAMLLENPILHSLPDTMATGV